MRRITPPSLRLTYEMDSEFSHRYGQNDTVYHLEELLTGFQNELEGKAWWVSLRSCPEVVPPEL